MMNKKYTMEDFKKMFDDARMEVLKDTEKDSEDINDPMGRIMFSVMSLRVTTQLEEKIFKKDKENK